MKIFSIGNANSHVLASPHSCGAPLLKIWTEEKQTLGQILVEMDEADSDEARSDLWSHHFPFENDVDATPVPLPTRLRPPIQQPSKILCVGRNYADHASETGATVPTEPLIFNKLPTTLIGHGAKILLPRHSRQVDFEAELVVVIGRTGREIPQDEAMDHVAGYTCGNDVSARDWQKGKPGQQWLLGKSFDTFAPLGPCFVPASEIPNPHSLEIQSRLNGEVMQRANTRDMLFSVEHLISYVSNVCTLKPGDLLFTGTPAGVGMARTPPVFLQPGDHIEVEIEGIGCLSNRCVSHDAGADKAVRK